MWPLARQTQCPCRISSYCGRCCPASSEDSKEAEPMGASQSHDQSHDQSQEPEWLAETLKSAANAFSLLDDVRERFWGRRRKTQVALCAELGVANASTWKS